MTTSAESALHAHRPAQRPLAHRTPAAQPVGLGSPDPLFVALLHAYRPHGGLARATDWLRAERAGTANGADVAPVHFEWAGHIWLPLFQFQRASGAVRADVARVAAELGRAFEGWHRARWFVEGNAWLGGQPPIERLGPDLEAVCAAARTDRFVALG